DRAILDVPTLADLLRDPAPPTLLDARLANLKPDRAAYDAGHLPGAAFVNLDRDCCGPPGPGGRHPLPDPAALERAVRRLGVRADHPVVVYEAGGATPVGSAARVWWTLRWAGHEQVQILDGGYAAWVAAGQPVSRQEPATALGDFVVKP